MRCLKRSVVVFCLLLSAINVGAQVAIVPAPAASSSAKPQKPREIGPFDGTVVDSYGKPVAGSKVLMLRSGTTPLESRVVAEAVTDEKGHFYFAKQPDKHPSDHPGGWFFAARDSKGRIAAQFSYWNRRQPPTPAGQQTIELRVLDGKDYRGRLLDTSGNPIAKAHVEITSWSDYNQEEKYSAHAFFPAQWQKELSAESDVDGRFTLSNAPTKGTLGVRIRAAGFGEPYGSLALPEPATLKLARAGSVEWSVSCSKEPKAAAHVRLRLQEVRTTSPRYDPQQRESYVSYYTFGTTNNHGSFRFDNVPAGRYQVTAELPASSPYYFDSGDPIEVIPGQTANASSSLKSAVAVHGRVVDQKTGEGIAGVNVAIYPRDSTSGPISSRPVQSDDKGNFTMFVRPGKGFLQIYQIPDGYLQPSQRRQQEVEVKSDTTLDPIRLEKGSAVEGVVVDQAGKPVPDAEIRYTDTEMGYSLNDVIRTDSAGKFSLKKTSPTKNYIVRARTKTAAAEPTTFIPAKLKESLKLVVDEKTAFTIRGTVVDEAGKPMPKVEVSLITHWQWAGGGVGFVFGSEKTDADGRFQFGGLWSGDKYQLRINAPDYVTFGSQQLDSTPGGVKDFGTITLAKANEVVEGKIVDSSGSPIEDVRVFNSGDGIKLMQTMSDKAGQFRLEGFRKGPVYVFAEKDGYRFSGALTDSGATGVTIKILRVGEPVPSWSGGVHALSEDEQFDAAKSLLEKLQKNDNGRYRAFAANKLAQINRELAKKSSNEADAKPVSSNDVKRIAEEDLDEALAIIAKQDVQFYSLKDLANHFALSDPGKAMRCAEEALMRARGKDQPERAVCVAQLASIVTRAGNKEAGQKLTDEAVAMAEKWTPTDRNRWEFGRFAVAVASNDVARALKLLEKIADKNQREQHIASIAVSLDDLDQAQKMLKDLQPWSAQRARARLAYRIAGKRPAEAVRLIEQAPSYPGYGDENESKAQTYGWLATAIAPKDKKLAFDLIDRAAALYLKPSDRSYGNYGGRSAQAAMLAVQAHEIGYPDMESLLYRVLATRPVPDRNDFSPVRTQESTVMMAQFLGLIDPQAARQLLRSVEPQSEAIGSGYSGVGRRDWLKVWALADPKHAVEVAEKELAGSKKDANTLQNTLSAMTEMIELWLAPPGQRQKYLTERSGGMFRLDQDY